MVCGKKDTTEKLIRCNFWSSHCNSLSFQFSCIPYGCKRYIFHGHIEKEMYLTLTDEAERQIKEVKLKKALYGLGKSLNYWNEKFNQMIFELGYERSKNDYCRHSDYRCGETIFVAVC